MVGKELEWYSWACANVQYYHIFQSNVPAKGVFCDGYDTIERFRTLIPVQDVQVRIGKVSDIDGHFWWELVHSRCDPEGRPERVYQFCNR